MPFVLDTSIAACWAFDDEDHPDAALALERIVEGGALVPALFYFEVRNVLTMAERRGRLTIARTARFLLILSNLAIEADTDGASTIILELARRHRLTFYDAAYLEIAMRRGHPIATLDRDLIKAARTDGVPLLSTP